MTQDSINVRAASDGNYNVWTAPYGTALPTGLPPGAPANFYGVGLLTDTGIGENYANNQTNIYDLAGRLQRQLRNQEQRTWTFEALERNAVTLGLQNPNTSITSSGGTAQVQTITISGTPTAGTWTATLPGYGTATGLAYNIATSALATALSNAFGITVTVSGTAGTSYVVTFPVASGSLPVMTATSSFTPTSASVSVAITTPGVAPTNRRVVGSSLAINRRTFIVDLSDGNVQRRVGVPNGEAVVSGPTTWTSSGAAVTPFTLTTYWDNGIGGYWVDLDNDPAQALTFQ